MQTTIDNQKFRKANKARKRVMIAKDVLLQLKLRTFKPLPSYWVQPSHFIADSNPIAFQGEASDAEVCDVFRKEESCQVCGLGALFVSTVLVADKLKMNEISNSYLGQFKIDSSDIFNYLVNVFELDQLEKIEVAFERGFGWCNGHVVAEEFVKHINDPAERMRLIMENIVANRGTFKPEVKPIEEQKTITVYSTPGYKE